MEPVRVWYSRNVSGTWQLIHLLRQGDVPVHVIGTYPRTDHLLLQACDEAGAEPVLPAEEWVEWALGFAARNEVDVFVPGEARQLAVARAADRFAAQGTRVQVMRPEVVEVLQDKDATYRLAASIGLPVPAYDVVCTADGLRASWERLRALGHEVVLKPVKGFGSAGFWKLTDEVPGLDDLLGHPSERLNVDQAVAMLARGGPVPPLMVSQYLSSPEDSVDLLADQGSLLAAVVRRKPSVGQSRSFPHDPELLELTAQLVEHVGLHGLGNVQWRRADGRPVLLEVNTRAASGLAQSCASGINFPALALRQVLGLLVEVPTPRPVPDHVTYTEAVPMHPLTPPR